MGDMIFVHRARLRAATEMLSWKNVRDRMRTRCIEAEAARRYADLSRLSLPPCGRAPTRFPYGDEIDSEVRRIRGVADRLDAMIRAGAADPGALLAGEGILNAAFARIEELIDERFDLVSACFDDEKSWKRAFLRDRVAYLGEILSSDGRSEDDAAGGMIGEVLDMVRRREHDTDYLLDEADTTLGIVLLDTEHRRYFADRTEGILRDVGGDLSGLLRLLPSELAKTASEIFGIMIVFGVTETQYRKGAVLPEATARNLFDIRAKLVHICESRLAGAGRSGKT